MNVENFKDDFKDRLKKIISKKFETATIYPLSQFEAAFGHLWGHGKDEKDLTPDEKTLRAKWKECRNNILNLGNQQKRNANVEIDQHDVIWNRYQTRFIPVDLDKE